MKHSNLKHSCYAHCSFNACYLQKSGLDVKVDNTSIFSTKREPRMEAVTYVQYWTSASTNMLRLRFPCCPWLDELQNLEFYWNHTLHMQSKATGKNNSMEIKGLTFFGGGED